MLLLQFEWPLRERMRCNVSDGLQFARRVVRLGSAPFCSDVFVPVGYKQLIKLAQSGRAYHLMVRLDEDIGRAVDQI
jgi:hypothetical protein